jgi:hypothetical protein
MVRTLKVDVVGHRMREGPEDLLLAAGATPQTVQPAHLGRVDAVAQILVALAAVVATTAVAVAAAAVTVEQVAADPVMPIQR